MKQDNSSKEPIYSNSVLEIKHRVISDREYHIKMLCSQQSWGAAAASIRTIYGPEIRAILMKLLGTMRETQMTFLMWCDDIQYELEGCDWSTGYFRTQAYRTIRTSLQRYRAYQQSQTPGHATIVEHNRYHALRRKLGDQDNLLLLLKVDRKLGWGELVEVLGDCDTKLSGEEMVEAVEQMRARFHLLKLKLKRLVHEEGI